MGPEITADMLLQYLLEIAGIADERCKIVPAEASAAVGLELLRLYGIITTNACGMPGAKTSIRLKTDKKTINRFGGAAKVADAFLQSARTLAPQIDNLEAMRKIILLT